MTDPVTADPASADPLTVSWTPGPSIELAPEVAALRRALVEAGSRLLEVPDASLESHWDWPGGDPDTDVDVRSGFYHLEELLELARGEALAALIANGTLAPPGARRGAAATAARWSLHGLLLGLADADLDRDPGGGEWTIRQTLGHTVNSQRSYARFAAWWLTQAATPGERLPGALRESFPDERDEAVGSVGDIRARLDALLDLSMARLGGLDERQVEVPARWSGGVVTVGFRIARWTPHIREHTIQIEKTLVLLGRRASEIERLVRLVFEAYGRLEELVFGLSPEQLRAARDGRRSPAEILAGATLELTRLAPLIVKAAQAAGPA